jgi:phenylacetate-CoA ligase
VYQSPFYQSSPKWLQESLLALRAWARARLREGVALRRNLRELDARQRLTSAELARFQLQSLKRLLLHAEINIPFYRRLFAARAFHADEFESLSQLAGLPILRKRDVLRYYGELMSEIHRGWKFTGTTSGTAGSAMPVTQDIEAIRREYAFVWRQLRWAGFRAGERRAWWRGDMVVPVAVRRPPFWRFNAAENMLMLSSYHLSEEHCQDYLRALRRFNPTLIQAYPSSLGYFARWLWNRGEEARIPALKAVVTSSETVTDEQRECIETVFGVRVFDWYGSAERVAAIGTCEHGRYHVMSDYGYTELLPADGGTCEIVGTGFNNFLMPLVRYGSRDCVTPADPAERCACGRAFPLVERIWGRMDDMIRMPDGRQVSGCVHGWIFEGVHGVTESQIVQKRVGSIELRVVPSGELPQAERARMVAQAKSRLGKEVEVTITEVKEIGRTRNGKLRTIVSVFYKRGGGAAAPRQSDGRPVGRAVRSAR